MASTIGVPSRDDQIELSLFGPGYGECVVINLGYGDWAVVDSCVDQNRNPVALRYLESLGLDPRQAVKLIVATHWHDDHVRGLSRLVEECENADVALSAALRGDEFLQLVAAAEPGIMTTTSGVTELAKALRVLVDRRSDGGANPVPIWSKSFTRIWSRSEHGKPIVNIEALSPSDSEMIRAWNDIASLLPSKGPKLRIIAPQRNHASVALWVRAGDSALLLGADLEEAGDSREGWSGIVSSELRPPEMASVFKLPHHGSTNGHSEGVWKQLLQDPVAVLTPFRRLRVPLPTPSDVVRICGLTPSAFATAKAEARLPPRKRPRVIQRAIKEAVISIRETEKPMGHIRLTRKVGGDPAWTVELLDAAYNLCSGEVPA